MVCISSPLCQTKDIDTLNTPCLQLKQQMFFPSVRDEIGLPVRNIISGEQELTNGSQAALMSRLWTGFFGTARCRYPEKFSKPGFQPKMA